MIYLLRLSSLDENAPCSTRRRAQTARLGNASEVRESLGAEAALWRAFADRYPHDAYPFDYGKTEEGKPFFENYPDFHFSLTHTKTWAACAALDAPCGVDVERVGRIGERVIERAFHPLEREYLDGLEDREREIRAAQIWCMREAYGKMKGKGLLSLTRDFYALPCGGCSDENCEFSLFSPDENHVGALCAERPLRDADTGIIVM